MSRKYDLPLTSESGTQPFLLDPNAGFYFALQNSQGPVYIQRYFINKSDFRKQAIGTQSEIRKNAYLVRETNFVDRGGGIMEFDRHYAEIPSPWTEYIQMSFTYERLSDSVSLSGGISVTSGTQTVLLTARIERSYVLGSFFTLSTQVVQDFSYFSGTTISAGTTLRPTEQDVYMGNIYEIREYKSNTSFTA